MSEKSPVQREFEDLIKKHLAPLFREHGFKRRGQTFARRWEAGWHVIQVQEHYRSSRDHIMFWINYAIRCDAHAVFCEDDPLKFPSEPLCEIRKRVALSGAQSETQWELWGDRRDIGVVGQVVAALTGSVLPWMDRCSSVDEICEMLRTTPPANDFPLDSLSVVAVLLRHDPARLRPVLEQMMLDAKKSGPRDVRRLEDWWGWPRLLKLLN